MPSSLTPETLDRLSRFVDRHLGLHFPEARHKDLLRGLARAAAELGLPGPAPLAREILSSRADRRLLNMLAGHLTIGETYFFRDKRALDLLRNEILPERLERARREGRCLRIWSAGCCTGEEPYTLAILLRELLRDGDEVNATILATDLNPRFLDKARRGIYRAWSFRETPERVRRTWFRALPDGAWELSRDIRSMVSLACLNLATDPYPALENRTLGQDIILCRNVLMYFSPELGRTVLGKLHRCLADDGLLLVSPSEGGLVGNSGLFDVTLGQNGILYHKKGAAVRALPGPTAVSDMQRPAAPAACSEEQFLAKPETPETGCRLDSPVEDEASLVANVLQDAREAVERGSHAEAGERLAAVDRTRLSPVHLGQLAHLTARLLAGSGDLAGAERACREAIAADKMHAGHHYLLAVVLQEERRPEEAVEALTKAIYLDQDFILAHFSLGVLLKDLGREKESRRSFANALAGLGTLRREEAVPESEGLTAGRLMEIIQAMIGY